MTVNSITAACNQKNNRDPIVEFEESAVVRALEGLRQKTLVSAVTGTGYRVQKYKHNAAHVYDLAPGESAIICLLLLRGPQTPGELRSRSGSLHTFQSLEEVDAVLDVLGCRPSPLAAKLPRVAGQKEARYAQLFCAPPHESKPLQKPAKPVVSSLEHRVERLESAVKALQDRLSKGNPAS